MATFGMQFGRRGDRIRHLKKVTALGDRLESIRAQNMRAGVESGRNRTTLSPYIRRVVRTL
jgi:hypothetical protein